MPKKQENVMGYILPAIRALIAKQLVEKHKMKQEEVAVALGVTQPAISQYIRDLRGSNFEVLSQDQNIMRFIDDIAEDVIENSEKDIEFEISIDYRVFTDKKHELNLKIDPKSKENYMTTKYKETND